MKPLFSCVIPVKGERPFMKEALASLEAQGMGDELEVIVQDGDVEPDCGQSDALNKGFARAKGEWLFWLNADDVLLPGALKGIVRTLEGSGCSNEWIAGNQIYIDGRGRVVKCLRANGWHDGLYRHAVPHVNGPSAFFRRELFEKVGGFDTSLHVCMDWDLWIRFMKSGARFRRMDRYLWGFRRWDGSKTQGLSRAADWHAEEVSRMLAKNGFSVTRGGVCKLRLWRCLNGNYLRSAWETFVRRGRTLNRVAILVKHHAPYRDPVLEALKSRGGIDVYAVFDQDRRHDWAGFAQGEKALNGRFLLLRLIWKFVLIRRYEFVLWPAYYPWRLTLPILLSALLHRHYALTSDTKDENGGAVSRMVKRFLFGHADCVWVPGRAARHYLVEKMGVKDDRIVEGLYVVSREEVAAGCRPSEGRREKFLMVANDIPERRMDVMVEAFRRWRSGGQSLVLCGKGCEKFTGGGVVGREGVRWADVPALYEEADIYVHNGREQYSTTVQIAAMRGMPIICSREVGIVADFQRPDEVMVLVDDWQSVDAWVAAFTRLEKMDAASVSEMSRRVADDARVFDCQSIAERVSRGGVSSFCRN